MILSTHSIVGASVANFFPYNPALGFSLSLASHYLLDIIPHRDYGVDGFLDSDSKTVKSLFNNMKAAMHLLLVGFDLFIGIVFSVLIFARDKQTFYITLIGVVGGVLPDVLQFLYYKYKKPFAVFQKIHDAVHNRDKKFQESIMGWLTQIFAVVLFVSAYFIFR